eukprot:1078598-Rhodomonas_salina.1
MEHDTLLGSLPRDFRLVATVRQLLEIATRAVRKIERVQSDLRSELNAPANAPISDRHATTVRELRR